MGALKPMGDVSGASELQQSHSMSQGPARLEKRIVGKTAVPAI